MSDLSQMSDDELMRMAGIADISDEQLKQIAGIKSKVEPVETIFSRAIKSISPQQIGYEVMGGTAPSDIGMGLGKMAIGGNFSEGLNIGSQAEGMRKKGAGDNFAADIVSDPMTWVGAGGAAKGVASLGKKAFPFISKESRVGFTKGVEKSLVNRRAALTRGFGSKLNKSKATVDISDIVDEGSEITKLTMKEAQDLKNAIQQGIPDAVKKGLKIDPKHFFSREIAGKIGDAMKKADPAMAETIEKYGKYAENFKDAIAPIKSSRGPENIFGSSLVKQLVGAGGSIPEKAQVALKEFAPRVADKVHGAKINENIFRGVRGTTAAYAASKFVPNFLKRALFSKATE